VRVTASRLDGGQPLRDAMKDGGWNRITLAARTREQEIDPDERGVSQQLIAFLSTDREWARDTCHPHSAALIAKALGVREDKLFAMPVSAMPAVSTHS
jgi:hypothetical protein